MPLSVERSFVPGWRTVSAVLAGERHRRQQAGCQDALRTAVVGDRWLLATLADGAGSAPLGAVGAELATAAALRQLAVGLSQNRPEDRPPAPESLVRPALTAAREALEREAVSRRLPLRQFAATLLVAVATPDWILAGQIGDGAVVIGDGDGGWRALTRPAAGEYLNETVFLTSNGALERAQVALHPGALREVALFSDGLQMLALRLADGRPHTPFFRPLFGWLARAADSFVAGRELAAWLRSPKVAERTDDDLSLCLALWIGPGSAVDGEGSSEAS